VRRHLAADAMFGGGLTVRAAPSEEAWGFEANRASQRGRSNGRCPGKGKKELLNVTCTASFVRGGTCFLTKDQREVLTGTLIVIKTSNKRGWRKASLF